MVGSIPSTEHQEPNQWDEHEYRWRGYMDGDGWTRGASTKWFLVHEA